MNVIVAFDCAVQDIGVSCVRVNTKWNVKFYKYLLILQQHLQKYSDNLQDAINTARKLHDIIDSYIEILYINVINLIPECANIKNTTLYEQTKRLKTFLCALDSTLPKINTVLIEFQMKQNDIARRISHQMLYHYSECANIEIKFTPKIIKKTNYSPGDYIAYALNDYPLVKHARDTEQHEHKPVNYIIPCSIKNKFAFCAAGEYQNFISRYSNYTANKKHTTYNFLYWLSVFKPSIVSKLKKIKKINDVADAFMMTYGWILLNL